MEIIVNGEKIENEVIDLAIQQVTREQPNLKKDQAFDFVKNDLIENLLLSQEADKKYSQVPTEEIDMEFQKVKSQFPNEDDFQNMCKQRKTNERKIKLALEKSLKLNLFIKDLAKNANEPTAEEVKKEYEDHKEKFIKPTEIRAAHIVKQVNQQNPSVTYNEMCELRKELLKKDADFNAMADKHSSCNDAGGDLGVFSRGKMVEEFDVILFSMNANELSPVFQTQFGYHIAKVFEILPEKSLSFDEIKKDLTQQIQHNLQNDYIGNWVDNLKKTADIKIGEHKI